MGALVIFCFFVKRTLTVCSPFQCYTFVGEVAKQCQIIGNVEQNLARYWIMPHKRLTPRGPTSWGRGILRIAETLVGSGSTPPVVMMWPMKERYVFFSTAFLELS